ncbi:hypothetical protein GGS23DRAFT_583750 [Durotheca rogersii]|uniref:uncharacterized protein n=1 Tax=Durotheca rogersii TaxID=419775 RepID=UPI00221E9B6F|nr:uncharacterized protein GGS23DRAFT_583750 [Durotheca rogersii]KAI5859816.1 hypothetical protein GGS23DRAFT_583750 [Durotheca rogersii]
MTGRGWEPNPNPSRPSPPSLSQIASIHPTTPDEPSLQTPPPILFLSLSLTLWPPCSELRLLQDNSVLEKSHPLFFSPSLCNAPPSIASLARLAKPQSPLLRLCSSVSSSLSPPLSSRVPLLTGVLSVRLHSPLLIFVRPLLLWPSSSAWYPDTCHTNLVEQSRRAPLHRQHLCVLLLSAGILPSSGFLPVASTRFQHQCYSSPCVQTS